MMENKTIDPHIKPWICRKAHKVSQSCAHMCARNKVSLTCYCYKQYIIANKHLDKFYNSFHFVVDTCLKLQSHQRSCLFI